MTLCASSFVLHRCSGRAAPLIPHRIRLATILCGACLIAALPRGRADAQLTLTISRDTGVMSLVNNSTATISTIAYFIRTIDGAFSPDSWKSIADTGDADSGGLVDATNVWLEFTAPGALSQNLAEGTLGQLAIAPGFSFDLGAAWQKSPHEDVTMVLRDTQNMDAVVAVQFVGNSGVPFALGDFETDGDVDGADMLLWQQFGPGPFITGAIEDWQFNYGQLAQAVPGTNVPEPGTGCLALGSAIGLICAPRRRLLRRVILPRLK